MSSKNGSRLYYTKYMYLTLLHRRHWSSYKGYTYIVPVPNACSIRSNDIASAADDAYSVLFNLVIH